MTGVAELFYPTEGVKASGGYGFDASSGLWLPVGGTAQGDGTVALKVTGAGATPSATSLKLADGAGSGRLAGVDTGNNLGVTVSNLPATQAVSEAHLPNLDITLSALRDAITKTGATAKTLADVVSALTATLTVQFPAAQHVTVDTLPAADVTDRAARLLGHVTVDTLPAVDVSDRSARLLGHVTVDSAPTTTVTGTVGVTDGRGLVERMMARAPAAGKHLWLDVTSSNAGYIYVAEAADGSASSATVFQGVRVALDASGNPLGAVTTASGFSWDNRATAGWTA